MGTRPALIWIMGGSVVGAVVTSSLFRAGGETPRTVNREWAAANKKYAKFQDMNPIGLGGRKAYIPTYLQDK